MTDYLGKVGGRFPLAGISDWPHEVTLGNWRARIDPRQSFLTVYTERTVNPADVGRESWRVAQRVLDSLSTRGVSAVLKDTWDGRVLWWRAEDDLTVRLTDVWALRLPFGIQVSTSATIETERPAEYHPSMRYFRLSQASPDYFSAFQFLWLAFEALVSSVDGMREDESERQWLRRALPLARERYRPDRQSLLAPEAIEHFIKQVYIGVRCAVFHAKTGRARIAPDGAVEMEDVRDGYRILMQHVLELMRPYAGWTLGTTPIMEHDFGERGMWLGGTPKFVLNRGEAARLAERNPFYERDGHFVFSSEWKREELTDVSEVALLQYEFPQFSPKSEFQPPLSLVGVSNLRVDLAVRTLLSQNIRTIWGRLD